MFMPVAIAIVRARSLAKLFRWTRAYNGTMSMYLLSILVNHSAWLGNHEDKVIQHVYPDTLSTPWSRYSIDLFPPYNNSDAR